MAKRPSIKDILEAARKGGPAKPAESESPVAASETPEAAADENEAGASVPAPKAASPAAARPAPAAPRPAPAAKVPTAAALGRPLSLKEKLAAARAGGAGAPAGAAVEASPAADVEATIEEPAAEVAPAEEPKAVPAPAPRPLGRPLTLQEKMAAARGAAAKPAGAGAVAAKPVAAKAAAAPAAKAGSGRALPPLEKITDPKDLAEAARQAAAKKAKELAAKAAAAAPAPAKPAPKAPPKPQTVPPRPTRELAAAEAGAEGTSRRGFFLGSLLVSWIAVAWTTFTAGITAMTLMTVRFMFPNVLAEPPSTIKIGLPSNYEPDAVNEKYKAESGFWVVRSSRYNGQDIIYALQSVCTHLGCPPNWLANEQKFKCPCHGSGFYISGINFEGPAPRPLERFKVTLADDGQILVDKSQKFQQELGQWSDPDSFIPA